MIKFRQKQYTLQEGHYTGPKDLEGIPGAISTIGKSTLIGAIANAAYGRIAGHDDSVFDEAFAGAKWGALAGIAAKLLLNYIHKPMTSVKYQDVDRNIRRQFGIFRMSGITVGDSLDKRATLEEKFSFNDRDVASYKINFAIHNNQITMYTLGLTNDELAKVNKTLDYYCKKYYSMEYTSKVINQRVNAYSADITFTNHPVLSRFIMELSTVLNTKINLLDNNAIVGPRIIESIKDTDEGGTEDEEKTFSSNISFSSADLVRILNGGLKYVHYTGPGDAAAGFICGAIIEALNRIGIDEKRRLGFATRRGDLTNQYLLDTLKKLRYIEGFHYTVGETESDFNISISGGLFIVTVAKKSKIKLDVLNKNMTKSDLGEVLLYTYSVPSDQEFKILLGRIMKLGKPNVFTGKDGKRKSLFRW